MACSAAAKSNCIARAILASAMLLAACAKEPAPGDAGALPALPAQASAAVAESSAEPQPTAAASTDSADGSGSAGARSSGDWPPRDTLATREAVDPRIERVIARELSDEEYRELDRMVLRGDLDGDGIEDPVVVVHMQSRGTAFGEYLIALPSRRGTPVVRAIGGMMLHTQHVAIRRDGRVVQETMENEGRDPMCCPNTPGRRVYALRGDTLALVDASRSERLPWP